MNEGENINRTLKVIPQVILGEWSVKQSGDI